MMGLNLKQMVVKRLLGNEIQAQVSSQVEERLKASAITVNDNNETGWRKITGNSTRDLSPIKQERMYEIVFHLWENMPLGKWLIEILKDFLVADGLPFEAENEDVSQALEDFWYDPLNQLDIYIEKHCREQWLFGVLCLPAFTAKSGGNLRLGYIDPAQIKDVVTDPGNVKMVIGVTLKDELGREGMKLRTILPVDAEDILSKRAQQLRAGFTDGECFYSAVNNLTNSPMGRSELLVTADWIDAHEQFLFDFTSRWPLMNAFVWDLTVDSGDPAAIKKEVDKITGKPGEVFGHNKAVTLEAVAPDLKTIEATNGNKMFVNHILGAHGFPSFWYGSGEGESGRALGVEQGTPAFKMLSSKQRAWKAFWELVFQTVIDRRRAANTLKCSDEDAKKWNVVLPELTSKDLTKNSAALQSVTTSLATAIQQEVIDTITARKIFLSITLSLGVDISESDVETRLKEELENRERKDYANGKTAPDMEDQGDTGLPQKGAEGA